PGAAWPLGSGRPAAATPPATSRISFPERCVMPTCLSSGALAREVRCGVETGGARDQGGQFPAEMGRLFRGAAGRQRPEPPSVLMTCPVIHLASSVDRKSTRLNSSHVKISYAVFCLK